MPSPTDERVVVLSVHEAGRWPFTGAAEDTGCGNVFNLPVPPGFNDAEMALLLDEVILPFGRELAPEIVVVQCGADALADDPLSKLALSNGALWRALAAIKALAPRLLVLGGGGYNPWSVARCWAGTGRCSPASPCRRRCRPKPRRCCAASPGRAAPGAIRRAHWFTTLEDKPNPGPISDAVALLACRMKARRRTLSAISAEAV